MDEKGMGFWGGEVGGREGEMGRMKDARWEDQGARIGKKKIKSSHNSTSTRKIYAALKAVCTSLLVRAQGKEHVHVNAEDHAVKSPRSSLKTFPSRVRA